MHSNDDDNTRRPFNAFSPEFLEADAERDEPAGGDDALGAGPFTIRSAPSREWPRWDEVHEVWSLGDRPEHGGSPVFASPDRTLALYAAITRPIAGREPLYKLGTEAWRGGYPLTRHGEPEGWMDVFHPEWALLLNALASFAASPQEVAMFLEAIGPSCRRRAGAILCERLQGRRG
jgi:hypothetical protein